MVISAEKERQTPPPSPAPQTLIDRQHQRASEMRLPLSCKRLGLINPCRKHPTSETWFTRFAVPTAHASPTSRNEGQPRRPRKASNQTETSNQNRKMDFSSLWPPRSRCCRRWGRSPTMSSPLSPLHDQRQRFLQILATVKPSTPFLQLLTRVTLFGWHQPGCDTRQAKYPGFSLTSACEGQVKPSPFRVRASTPIRRTLYRIYLTSAHDIYAKFRSLRVQHVAGDAFQRRPALYGAAPIRGLLSVSIISHCRNPTDALATE